MCYLCYYCASLPWVRIWYHMNTVGFITGFISYEPGIGMAQMSSVSNVQQESWAVFKPYLSTRRLQQDADSIAVLYCLLCVRVYILHI